MEPSETTLGTGKWGSHFERCSTDSHTVNQERFYDSVIPVISIHPRGLKTQIMDVYSSTPGTAELHLVNE